LKLAYHPPRRRRTERAGIPGFLVADQQSHSPRPHSFPHFFLSFGPRRILRQAAFSVDVSMIWLIFPSVVFFLYQLSCHSPISSVTFSLPKGMTPSGVVLDDHHDFPPIGFLHSLFFPLFIPVPCTTQFGDPHRSNDCSVRDGLRKVPLQVPLSCLVDSR